jgi:hypothetical protein
MGRSIPFAAWFAAGCTALALAGCAEVPPPPPLASFGDFTPPAAYAHFLACPDHYCLATPDEITPLLKLPAEKLRDIARKVLDAEPETELVSEANEGLRLVYRQSPSLIGPADTVTVEIVDAEEGVSAIVLYSQTETPSADRATQARRVRHWLDAIDKAVVAATR